MVTYPLDTAGTGLPVRELRLNIPILCRQRKRKLSVSPGPVFTGQTTGQVDAWSQVSTLEII